MMPAPNNVFTIALACLLIGGLNMPPAMAQDTLQVTASADERQFLADAESMLSSGQSQAAFTLLATRERELAGNPYYDYLLGIAALDSGQYSEAIFSLRRSLDVSPGFSGARLELARAYYESGNSGLARPLFVNLLDENPPAAVRTIINNYIASIDSAPSLPKSSFNYAFDVTGGYDDNANGSTNSQQFMGFMLSPENLKTESSFLEAGAAVSWNNPKSTQFGWYAAGRAAYRHNPDADFVDSGLVSGNGGMNWQRGQFFGRAGIDGYWATRDGNPNESYLGLDALFGNRIANRWDVTFGIRGGALRHDDAIETLDVDRILYSGGLNYRFGSPGNIGFELIGGKDSEKQAGSPYGNSKLGGRLTLYLPVSARGALFASIGSLTSDYDGLFFGTAREDTQVSALLQITYQDVGVEGLSLTPRIRHINNDSNIALYDYDRTEIGLQLRWMPQ
jgi:tetratricopeptide (TPR) repeat protein